jgi:TPR repeat protein
MASAAYEAFLAKDYERAMELYEPLARSGSIKAMLVLANIYNASDVRSQREIQDFDAARYWYEKAFEKGRVAEAALALGDIHFAGRGVPIDYKKSLHYYKEFEVTTSAVGLFRLAIMYEVGLGTGKDVRKARRLYARAAKLGNIYARKNLGVLLWKYWRNPVGPLLRLSAICQGMFFFIFKKNSPRIRVR